MKIASRFHEIQLGICVLGVFLRLLPSAHAQTFTGEWAGTDKVLNNGTPHRIFLKLRESDGNIEAVLTTVGFRNILSGTVSSSHLEIFKSGKAGDRSNGIVGDLRDGRLVLRLWDRDAVTLMPAVAGDEIPTVSYITPPNLHPVSANGLARTPPMGWNSWNKFRSSIDDVTVRQIADAMVSNGMRDAGYVYLNIDDTWEGVRDANGVLQPNHNFPDMKALADYVHSKGLKLGIYSSPGPATCGGYPGSYGYEEQDARTWASWGIDYLKYDWCSAGKIYSDEDLQAVYQKMGDALAKSGRSIVYSLCEYGRGDVQKWGPEVGANLWRTTDDIHDSWSSMSSIGFGQSSIAPFAGPGHWNDPDMLEIGNDHMTAEEYRTHMSLWSLLAAPLLAGNDIRNMSQETKDLLLNKEVIAVDQDSLGSQAVKLFAKGNMEIWFRHLSDGCLAVGIFNRASTPLDASLHASDLKLAGISAARDLWAHKNLSLDNSGLSVHVPAHGVVLLKITPASHVGGGAQAACLVN